MFTGVVGSSPPPRISALSSDTSLSGRVLLLPGEEEADIAGLSPRVFEHFGLQPESERPQMIMPKFMCQFGSTLQRLVPARLEVVDGPAAIGAEFVGKAIDLNLGLPARPLG